MFDINSLIGSRKGGGFCLMWSNDSKKILFVHIPRTSGKSISAGFGGHVYKQWHITPASLQDEFVGVFSDYRKFTIVRNPWYRHFSMYYQMTKGSIPWLDWFDQEKDNPIFKPHFKPQSSWYKIGNETVVDRIFRYEDGYDGIKEYIPTLNIPKRNNNDRTIANIEDYINQEIVDQISEIDSETIELFDYKYY